MPIAFVASPRHPLASYPDPISEDMLAKHVQLVLTDHSTLSKIASLPSSPPKTWRLADLGSKHAFLPAGLGWGGMPLHVVETDLASGVLVQLTIVKELNTSLSLPMSAVYLASSPPGPAGRWLVKLLKSMAAP